jgi:putative Ca2+/H+ antiporter (TMEM165/GDT1 family)
MMLMARFIRFKIKVLKKKHLIKTTPSSHMLQAAGAGSPWKGQEGRAPALVKAIIMAMMTEWGWKSQLSPNTTANLFFG